MLPTIKIFISSSGDLTAEREAALRAVSLIQRECSDQVILEAYRWEDNVREFDQTDTYQLNIPLPREFDIFLGFIFSRVGMDLTTDEYTQLMMRSAIAAGSYGKPEIPDHVASSSAVRNSDFAATLPTVASGAPPTGTQFEIENALSGLREKNKPKLWLAINCAEPGFAVEGRPNTRSARIEEYKRTFLDYIDELGKRKVPINDTWGRISLEKISYGRVVFKNSNTSWRTFFERSS